jgi:hypothetical protein
MSETLFTRLASYSQNPTKQSLENFTTEVVAYLVNNDKVFRRIFVQLIVKDRRSQRAYKKATAKSQQGFGNGIVDIVLTATSTNKILVEVKLTAKETETKIYGKGWVSQIQKYLNLKIGRVAYLTTKSVESPNLESNTNKFLGQFYFEDFYDKLNKARKKLTDCGQLFLEFMEENKMKPLAHFTRKELNGAENAFCFAKKCEAFLNELKPKIEPEFRKLFRSRTQFTSGHFSPTYESAYFWAKGKLSGYKKVRWIGIYIWLEEGKLIYTVYVKVLQNDIEKLNRHLQWEKVEDNSGLFNPHLIKPNTKVESCFKSILKDLKNLNRELTKIH